MYNIKFAENFMEIGLKLVLNYKRYDSLKILIYWAGNQRACELMTS